MCAFPRCRTCPDAPHLNHPHPKHVRPLSQFLHGSTTRTLVILTCPGVPWERSRPVPACRRDLLCALSHLQTFVGTFDRAHRISATPTAGTLPNVTNGHGHTGACAVEGTCHRSSDAEGSPLSWRPTGGSPIYPVFRKPAEIPLIVAEIARLMASESSPSRLRRSKSTWIKLIGST